MMVVVVVVAAAAADWLVEEAVAVRAGQMLSVHVGLPIGHRHSDGADGNGTSRRRRNQPNGISIVVGKGFGGAGPPVADRHQTLTVPGQYAFDGRHNNRHWQNGNDSGHISSAADPVPFGTVDPSQIGSTDSTLRDIPRDVSDR